MFNKSNFQLRTELDRILKENKDQSAQEEAIKNINKLNPNSIERAWLDDFCEMPIEHIPEYDCFTFALDLIDSQIRIEVRDFAPRKIGPFQRPGIADALPGPNFIHYLQLQGRSSLSLCQDYDLAIYFDSFGMIKHIGKIFNGNIVSKWGLKGYLWQHGIWEIPNSYGIEVKFYSQLPKKLIVKKWNAYLYELANKVKEFTEIVLNRAQQSL
jgi:hypothetical protein